ncbi:MAG: NUDIX hydrolase [Bacilli bacterium]|nr:NUDIX hydrolase [Bacilli bacterium]
MSDKREIKKSSTTVYDGRIINVTVDKVTCPNGRISTREIVHHRGGVCILGVIDSNIIMEKQYRYAYDEELYELPAGKLEKGEDSYVAGIREFEEETGYKAESLTSLGVMYPTCGYSNEIIYLYLANNIVKSERHLDEDEVIDVLYIPLEKVLSMIEEGTIKDAKTICAISKYLLLKRN